MKILTSEEMRDADRRSSEEFGIPLEELMEGAGAAVASFCRSLQPAARRVLVICGKGNNGGDGLVAARCLAGSAIAVRVLLLSAPGEFRGEAEHAYERLRQERPEVEVSELPANAEGLQGGLDWADLIVDAVVGTGFRPPLRGTAVAVRDGLERVSTPVVAVDLPSGWDADAMTQHGGAEAEKATISGAFRAGAVLTFTAPKPAHVFGHLTPGETFGPVVVAAIGSPVEAVRSGARLTWAGTSKRITERPRDVNSNKGRFGHVLVVGGSSGKAGAPSMAALAALRAGAGLVTAAVPEGILNTVALITPELMVAGLSQGAEGAASLVNLDEARLQRLMKGVSVLAIGPGLSTEGEASEFARGLVATTRVPVVIDVDALNAFAGRREFLRAASGAALGAVDRVVVLTPHPGEMARLAGMTVKEVEADRVGLARRFATEHGVTLVLKGWRTLVAHPDGRIAVNTTGNPAMAKGGSGDILTGIVAAMVAQYGDRVDEAVEAAVYLHGLAADLAVGGEGGMDEHTLLATDTVAHLSAAFRHRSEDENGFTWICGRPGAGLSGVGRPGRDLQQNRGSI
ncbi:MAG: bifunctional ADP-dependent NAD(P)H-hydrate dehydratase/NAD(P)H-hydrate epimerase [Acidobacteriaceae bacterium]